MTSIFDWFNPTGAHQSAALSGSVNTLTVPAGSHALLVQATGQNARFTIGGTDPSASSGFQLRAGNSPMIVDVYGKTLKFTQETSGATLEYQFLG
jgi:hypothetical protein